MDTGREIVVQEGKEMKTKTALKGARATSPFLVLPLEVRNMIYDLLIYPTVVSRPANPTFNFSTRLWENPWADTDQLDLSITTAKVLFHKLRLPSNIIFANHQTYNEMSSLI